MFGMSIDVGPKFYGHYPHPAYDLNVKVIDLEILCKSFPPTFLRSLKLLNPCMDLLYIWHDYVHILFGIIPIPAYDLEVKVTD